jgi:adenylate cyclase
MLLTERSPTRAPSLASFGIPDRTSSMLYPWVNPGADMRTLHRIVLEEAVIGSLFMIGVYYVYYFLAIWGFMDHFEAGDLKAYVTGPAIHVELLVSAVGLGVLLAVVNHLLEVPAVRHRPLGQVILLRSGLYLLSLALVVLMVNGIFLLFFFSWQEMEGIWSSLSPRVLVSIGGLVVFGLVALTFLLEIRRKVGPGNLWALLTGRYHRPREESRVFLFLDLKGSTSIAERLGHARYSQFIRHCYQDLTEFILLFRAQIYQFVGDEVVLTWPAGMPEAERHSLETFFGFQNRLRERQAWYTESFGVAPEFRGGVEEGTVTVTEVGDIKREIAFHGDVLNTAARLLDLCRKLEQSVLVSGRVQETIAGEPGWITEPQGDITLRGKSEPVTVYGVAESTL